MTQILNPCVNHFERVFQSWVQPSKKWMGWVGLVMTSVDDIWTLQKEHRGQHMVDHLQTSSLAMSCTPITHGGNEALTCLDYPFEKITERRAKGFCVVKNIWRRLVRDRKEYMYFIGPCFVHHPSIWFHLFESITEFIVFALELLLIACRELCVRHVVVPNILGPVPRGSLCGPKPEMHRNADPHVAFGRVPERKVSCYMLLQVDEHCHWIS